MALLNKLKSLLGLSDSETSTSRDVGVTVEQDGRDVETETEDAVKGTGDVEEPIAEETSAAASTESLVDEEATEAPDEAAEPAEAEGPDEVEELDEAEALDDPEADLAESDPEEAEPEPSGEPVESIKGIGPAYAEKLDAADIETVDDLAKADAEAVADDVEGIGPNRIAGWIERAKARR